MKIRRKRVIEREVDYVNLVLYEMIFAFKSHFNNLDKEIVDQLNILLDMLTESAGYSPFEIECDILDEKICKYFLVNEFLEYEDDDEFEVLEDDEER